MSNEHRGNPTYHSPRRVTLFKKNLPSLIETTPFTNKGYPLGLQNQKSYSIKSGKPNNIYKISPNSTSPLSSLCLFSLSLLRAQHVYYLHHHLSSQCEHNQPAGVTLALLYVVTTTTTTRLSSLTTATVTIK